MILIRGGRGGRSGRGASAVAVALVGGVLTLAAILAGVRGGPGVVVGALLGGAAGLAIGVAWGRIGRGRRREVPARDLVRRLGRWARELERGTPASTPPPDDPAPPRAIGTSRAVGVVDVPRPRARETRQPALDPSAREALSRSGLYDPPSESVRIDGSSQVFGDRDMLGRLDPESLRWTEASPALQAFLGADLDRLRRRSILELLQPVDRPAAARRLREAGEVGEALGLIYRISTPAGDRKAIELNVSTRYDADGRAVYLRCHVTDVTDRLRARREERRRTRELLRLNDELRATNTALAELKDRYSDLYQNAPAMYFSLDHDGRLLVCNETMLKTLGYSRRTLIGRSYEELLPEDHRPWFRSRFAQFLKDGRIEVESRWVTRDGRPIDVLVTAVAVRDRQGRLIHSRSVAQDISARKRLEAELVSNNARLARINDELSRKNTELDEFSYVISHDLQEPIRTLIAFSGFLKQDYADRLDDQAREYLDYLAEASTRMRALIRDLLELSRAGRAASDFGPVPLEEVLISLRVDYAELIRSREAEVVVDGPLPTAWGDRTRIGQLLGNLICNGLKYNESRPPRVEVGLADGPSPGAGRRVTLAIRDNGIGIDPQYHEAIFQMFRRLHPRDRYEGTGAGLAICQKIARAHGGRLWVESRPGAGSTFFVDLPLAPIGSRPASSAAEVVPPPAPATGPNDALHAR